MQSTDTIIIGAGISGLTAAYKLHQAGVPVRVIEASERVGGLIQTHQKAGFTFEGGPNTFPNSALEILSLCEALGLQPKAAHAKANKRYLFLKNKLTALPNQPWQAFTTPLLSIPGKIRLLCEPFKANRPADDISVAGFFAYRLGREVVDNLVDPFISGIYAGNVEALSLPVVFPKLWQWVQDSGSLFAGAKQTAKLAKENNLPKKPPMKLLSFENGLQTLTDALAAALPEHSILLNQQVVRIEKNEEDYLVRLHTGEWLSCKALVLATPAYVSAQLLEALVPVAVEPLSRIPYNGLTVTHLGYEQNRIKHPLDGFGCLIPRRENIPLLGTIWASSLFPERAPAGKVLLSNFLGGAHHLEVLGWKASQVQGQVVRDLQKVFHIQGSLEPVFSEVTYYERAIPQYNLGHRHRIATIEAALKRHPQIQLAGNYIHGIALNECVKSGLVAAETIIQAHS